MGLDTVELVMEVEDTFKIKIADEEAERTQTIGELHALVLTKLEGRKVNEYCTSQRTFYSLRRFLSSYVDRSLKKIRPMNKTEDYFPPENRRKTWEQFSQDTPYRFPNLCRPEWVIILLCLIFAVTTFLGFMLFRNHLPVWLIVVFLFPWAYLFYILTVLFSEPLAVEIPSDCNTLGGLTQSLVSLNYDTVDYDGGNVKEMLYEIISEQFGVNRDTLTSETTFVGDLGG